MFLRHVHRTNTEHEQIFQIMTQFPEFMALDQRPDLLKQAIETAYLEISDDIRQPGLLKFLIRVSIQTIFDFLFSITF